MDDQFHNSTERCCEEAALIQRAVGGGLITQTQNMIYSCGKSYVDECLRICSEALVIFKATAVWRLCLHVSRGRS